MKKSKTKADKKMKTVADFEKALAPVQEKIFRKLRRIILKAEPDLEENIKWNMPCYSLCGLVCYIAVHRSHVNLGFYRGGEIDDPDDLFDGKGKKLRHIKIVDAEEMDASNFTVLIKKAIKLNIEQ